MCSKASAELPEPLLMISNLRFSQIMRLEILHMSYNTKKSGARIQQLRARNGYTQEEFAKMLNIDRSNLSRIESGKRGCSLDLLVQLSDLFDVSLDDLVLGENKPDTLSVGEKRHLKENIETLIGQLEAFKSTL